MRYTFQEFAVDTQLFELRKSGVLVPIQPKPLDLLMVLLAHRGRVLTRSELMMHLWPGVRVTNNALVQAVANLRDALGDTGSVVVSIRGRGYRFVERVTENAEWPMWSALSDRTNGFVMHTDDSSTLDEHVRLLADNGRSVLRFPVTGSPPLSAIRGLLARVAADRPRLLVNGRPLGGALAYDCSESDITALALAFFLEECADHSVFVLEHLERADVQTLLLFSVIASTCRQSRLLLGTCALGELPHASVSRRMLAPLVVETRCAPPSGAQVRLREAACAS